MSICGGYGGGHLGLRRIGLCTCLALATGLMIHPIVNACSMGGGSPWFESYDQVDTVVRGRVDNMPFRLGLAYLTLGTFQPYRITTIERWKGPDRATLNFRTIHVFTCGGPDPIAGFEYLIMANESPFGLVMSDALRLDTDSKKRLSADLDRRLGPATPLAEVYSAFGRPQPSTINPLRALGMPGSWVLVTVLLVSVAMRFGARSRASERMRQQLRMGGALGRSAGMWSGMATSVSVALMIFGVEFLHIREGRWSEDLMFLVAMGVLILIAGGLPGALIGRLLGAAAGRVAAKRPEVNPRRIGVATASVAALLGVWALQGTLLFSPLLGVAELIAVGFGWVAGRRFEEIVKASQG